jgi:hypothetical protein
VTLANIPSGQEPQRSTSGTSPDNGQGSIAGTSGHLWD